MSQSLAILVDASRELRSRSLFWVGLAISALTPILLFLPIGFEPEGWRMLWFEVNESDFIFEGSDGARDLMAWLFAEVFVRWWVCWGAIMLAVVTTASMLPDFLAEGSIDFSLSKPIGRIRLLWLRIGGAFLFVAVQTTVSVVIAWLALGLKMDLWMTGSLLAIPLVLVQFFYLYAIAALVGVTTRSALASLLATMLVWSLLSIVQFSANTIAENREIPRFVLARYEQEEARIRDRADAEERPLTAFEERRLEGMETSAEPLRTQLDFIDRHLLLVERIERFVPKTGDVQKLISARVEAPSLGELMAQGGGLDAMRPPDWDDFQWEAMQEASVEGKRAAREVRPLQSLGSSIAVSALLFGLATLRFVRRDY